MATKNAIISGVSAGDTSVTFETTKDWAIPAELTIPISVVRNEEFYLLNEETNGKKSYIAFIADLRNYTSTYKEPSFKCLRLYLNDGTLLRCVKATRIENITADTKHKYFVNLDKGNVDADLFSYFELIFSKDVKDPLKVGYQQAGELITANVTFNDKKHIKIGYICPTGYYTNFELAPFMKNDIWNYAKNFEVSMLEQYFIFKDSSITADDISKIGIANHSYTDKGTASPEYVRFNYLLLKKLNYRGVELSRIEIDETNFYGAYTYYIDLFLKDNTFKMWDYMSEFFKNPDRYDEDLIKDEDLYDYSETGDAILDEYNKLDRPFNTSFVGSFDDSPDADIIDECPASINTSGLDFFTIKFKGQGLVNDVELIWMISMFNLRFYLANGDLLYPINIKKLNADLSADMPTNEALGNVYEEYEVILSKAELASGYPTTMGSLVDNGISIDDSPDYVKIRFIVNKLYYGLDLYKYTSWVIGRYQYNQYLSLTNYRTSSNNQTMQIHLLFDNDSRITPDELGKISMNNSIELGSNVYSGSGYQYGFNQIYVARNTSNNTRKSYWGYYIESPYLQRCFTWFIELSKKGLMLRDASNRWVHKQLNDGTIIPERYL